MKHSFITDSNFKSMPLKIQKEELPGINLTSMIDVVFLLIIFFMVGTRFTNRESSVEIDLPTGSPLQSIVERPPARQVVVAADGTISMNNRNWTVAELASELQQASADYPDLTVEIRGDRNVPFGVPLEVFTAVKSAGIHRVEIPFETRR